MAISIWLIFKLFLWKNWCHQRENIFSTILSIICPPFFCMIIVVLRFVSEVEYIPETHFNPVDINEAWAKTILMLKERHLQMETVNPEYTASTFIPELKVGYAPNTDLDSNRIMAEVQKKLNIENVGYDTCHHLREGMIRNHYFAGVCFTLLSVRETVQNNISRILNYTLIFPSKLRFVDDSYVDADWNTNDLYDFTALDSSRCNDMDDGGYVGYIREGFIPLQHSVAVAYINLIADNKFTYNVFVQRFPIAKHVHDQLVSNIEIALSMTLLCGLVFPIMDLSSNIVKEKEKKLKDILNILGVSDLLQLSAWFIKGYCLLFISTIFVTIILKVRWCNDRGILPLSSGGLLFIFIMIYYASSISFVLMLSSLFTRRTTAITLTVVLWFLSYMPFVFYLTELQPTLGKRIFVYLLSNSAAGWAFTSIVRQEEVTGGFTWDTFFETTTIDAFELSIVQYAFILIVQAFAYMFLALAINFFKPRLYRIMIEIILSLEKLRTEVKLKFSKRRRQQRYSVFYSRKRTKVFQVDPAHKSITVQLKNITKFQQGVKIINNLSINFYENEITTLMGHNSSGKNTLISIILGLNKPSSGTVMIHNIDIYAYPDQARLSLGVYMQNIGIFKELTVADQLMFFSTLKGSTKAESVYEQERYLTAINLYDIRHTLTRHLTRDARQNLAVCCALVGQSKIIVLDLPSNAMDMASRRLLWNLLNTEKHGRTIIVTTHSPQEANAISDRIVILSGGELMCSGTTYFLKTIYGMGYRLVMTIHESCDIGAVTNLLNKYIPFLLPDCLMGNELSYMLYEKHIELFDKMLNDLENNMSELKIISFWISTPEIKNVFLQMGAQDPSDGVQQRYLDILSGKSIFYAEYDNLKFIHTKYYEDKYQIFLNHCKAMFLKHIYLWRIKHLFIISAVLPISNVYFSFTLDALQMTHNVIRNCTYDLSPYRMTLTPIGVDNNVYGDILGISNRYYQKLEFNFNHRIVSIGNKTFGDHIMENTSLFDDFLTIKIPIGVTFHASSVVAWFSNIPMHSVPLSLNLVHQAIVSYYSDNQATISVTLEPLRTRESKHRSISRTPVELGNFLAMCLTITVACIWSLCVLFLTMERVSKFQLLQFLSGLSLITWMLGSFVMDMLKVLILAATIIITIYCFQDPIFNSYILAWYFVVLVTASCCISSCNHLHTILFKNYLTSYIMCTAINIFGACAVWAYVEVIKNSYDAYEIHKDQLRLVEMIYWIFPQFALCNGLMKIFRIGELIQLCEDEEIKLMTNILSECELYPKCCEEYMVWDYGSGIIPEIITFLVLIIISWLVIILIYINPFQGILVGCKRRAFLAASYYTHIRSHQNDEEDNPSNYITKEKVRVLSLKPREFYNKPLVCNEVALYDKKSSKYTQLFLLLNRGECLALTGPNGSGKSFVLKTLVGDKAMKFGSVRIKGIDSTRKDVHRNKHISYSPQVESLLPMYSGIQLLRLFALLRGIPRKDIEYTCENLAKVLGFYPYYHKPLYICSTGIRKRISYAIALLGTPSVIFLDEPANNIDWVGKLQLWNILSSVKSHGSAIVVSSNDSRDTNRIHDRIALTFNGDIQFIGNSSELINFCGDGYCLELKLRSGLETININYSQHNEHAFFKVIKFLDKKFPSTIIKSYHGNMMTVILPWYRNRLSYIFSKIRKSAFILHIEDFRIHTSVLSLYSDILQSLDIERINERRTLLDLELI